MPYPRPWPRSLRLQVAFRQRAAARQHDAAVGCADDDGERVEVLAGLTAVRRGHGVVVTALPVPLSDATESDRVDRDVAARRVSRRVREDDIGTRGRIELIVRHVLPLDLDVNLA